MVSTLAGNGTAGSADGPPLQAMFRSPMGIAVDPHTSDRVYVADSFNHRIRVIKLTAPGGGALEVTTLVGSDAGDVDGSAQFAQFRYPYRMAADLHTNNTLYVVSSTRIRTIKLVAPGGAALTVSTLAGNGTEGFADGPPHQAVFRGAFSIAVDPHLSNTLYVADSNNHCIRTITLTAPGGIALNVTTLAGNYRSGYSFADGAPLEANFSQPLFVAVDPHTDDTLYVVSDNRIRVIKLDTPSDADRYSTVTKASSSSISKASEISGTSRLSSTLAVTSMHPVVTHPGSVLTPIAVVVSYVTVLAGGSVMLSSIQTVAAISSLRSRCDSGGISDPLMSNIVDNPLQIRLETSGDEMAYVGGSLLGNSALCFSVILIKLAITLFVLVTDLSSRTSLSDALLLLWSRFLHLPGVAWAPFMLVLQPVSVAAVASLVSLASRPGLRAAGAIFLVGVVFLLFAVGFPLVSRGVGQMVDAFPLKEKTKKNSLERLRWLFSSRWEWNLKQGASMKPSTQFLFRFGDVLAAYRGGRQWFVILEGCVAMVSGVVSGASMSLSNETQCSFQWAFCAALVTLYTVFLIAVALLQPYNAPIDTVATTMTTLLTILSLCLLILSPLGETLSATIGIIVLLQSTVGLLSFPVIAQRLVGGLPTLLGRFAVALRLKQRTLPNFSKSVHPHITVLAFRRSALGLAVFLICSRSRSCAKPQT